ncbi:hypothetical protein [uncultured Piscinibacter sp.]|uniref:hypothetical protein n=1 Tax=uncultured Piscinibacter sp. TaxID=1131835 RepID=UPI0026053B19|nr:hypothetical protein [uncultured Piscinibacter sp.]
MAKAQVAPVVTYTVLGELHPSTDDERKRAEASAKRNRILMALAQLEFDARSDDELRAELFAVAGNVAREKSEWLEELREASARPKHRPKKWTYGRCMVFLIDYFLRIKAGHRRADIVGDLRREYELRTDGAVDDRIGDCLAEIGGIDRLPETLRETAKLQRERRKRTTPRLTRQK